MSLPQYSRYKDSGVEWLGFIPEHWHVGRLKNSVLSSKGGIWGNEESFDDNDIACVRVADFDRSKLRVALENPTIRNVLQSERNGRILERGDLLLEKSGGGENQLVGCVVMYEHDEQAVCSNFVARLKLEADMVSEYWCYVHFALYALRINYCSINQTSGIQNLDQDKYLNEIVPYPDFSEQSAIATFLDRETAKIDTLISEQEKLITLLAEKRQATISHAVTKGLNPDAPMKDSGVEWMKKVPQHWQVLTLERVTVDKCDGPFGSGIKSEHYMDEGALVVRLQNIRADEFNRGIPVFLDYQYFMDKLQGHDVKEGDLLVAGLGDDNNLLGRACVAPKGIEPALVKADCFRFRLNTSRVLPSFAAAQLSAGARNDAGRLSSGSTRSRIPLGTMTTRRVALPPLAEQSAIVDFLHREVGRADILTNEATRGISLLKERRSALISAAVTGKIDVRQAAQQEQITIQEAA